MSNTHISEPTPRKPIRLWPGVAIVTVQSLLFFGIPVFASDVMLGDVPLSIVGVLAGVAGGLAVVLWWLFFSRAFWVERVGVLALLLIAPFITRLLVHASIAGGTMGMMTFGLSFPLLSLGLVIGAAAGRHRAAAPRRVALVVSIVLASGSLMLVRTNGVKGGAIGDFKWRWTKTAEERLLAQGGDQPLDSARGTPATPVTTRESVTAPAAGKPAAPPSPPGPATETPAGPAVSARGSTRVEWPGFRGPGRDGIVRGVEIKTDWTASPPVQLWRRPIGPGWSSFAVSGDLLYTQEQRGDHEIVACYRVLTGEPVWQHRDKVRFWESNGGAGPRGTPTLSNGRVYTFGATGMLNALDARDGAVVWSRNVATDAAKKVPIWGFSSSPLVEGEVVIVAASGKLVGYDAATGKPRWFGPARLGSYSSPHLATIHGVRQILLLTGSGATSVSPADGTVLWDHAWEEGATIVQPALMADGDILINAITGTGGIGTRRLAVGHTWVESAPDARGGPAEWTVTERWTSTGLKPYFSDFVVHKGHAYGFDGSMLSCIDLEDGKRIWKGGRYGGGQLVLLPDQDVLLVISEDGELALVSATTEKFVELARFPGLDAKTWNHPVLAGDVLLVRNGEEMAAFRLALAGR